MAEGTIACFRSREAYSRFVLEDQSWNKFALLGWAVGRVRAVRDVDDANLKYCETAVAGAPAHD